MKTYELNKEDFAILDAALRSFEGRAPTALERARAESLRERFAAAFSGSLETEE